MVRRGRCRRGEERQSECLKCCAFLGRYKAVLCRGILPGYIIIQYLFERKRNDLLEIETSFGKNPLGLNKNFTAL